MAVIQTPHGCMTVRGPFTPKPSPFSRGGKSSRGGGGSSRRSTPQVNARVSGNTVFINEQGFSVLPQDQASFIRSHGGSVSSQLQNQIQAQQKLAIEKARLENIRKQAEATALRNKELAAEQQRIKQLEQRLLREGATRRIQNLTDSVTGDKIQHDVLIKNNNERIFIVRNLTTGEISTRTFEQARNKSGGLISGRTFETGGLSGSFTTQKQANEIAKNLPPGDKLIYNKTTGTINGIRSSVLGKSIPWTKEGLAFYNKQIEKLGGLAYVQGMSVKKISDKSKIDKLEITKKLENFYDKIGIIDKAKINALEKDSIKKIENWQRTTNFGRNTKVVGEGLSTLSVALFIDLPIALVRLGGRAGIGAFRVGERIGEKILTPKETLKQLELARKSAFSYVNKKGSSILKESKKITAEKVFRLYLKNQHNQRILNKTQYKFALKNYAKYIDFNKMLIRKDVKIGVIEKVGSESFIRSVRRSGRVALNTFIIATGTSIVQMPSGFVSIINNPKNITKIPKALVTEAKDNMTLLKTSPAAGIGKIGSDIFVFYITGKIMKITGKFTSSATAKLNPFLKKFKNGTLKIKVPAEIFTRNGGKVFLSKRVANTTVINKILSKVKKKLPKDSKIFKAIKIRKKGQFRKFQKTEGLTLKEQTVKTGALEYSKQLEKYSGKTVTGVNAAADIRPLIGGKLSRLLRQKKLIRKPLIAKGKGLTYLDDYAAILKLDPIGGKPIVRLLKKLDAGKTLSIDDVARLNGWFRKNIDPNLSILERSLYLDPDSGVRLSRLAVDEARDATLGDLLSGNFKFPWQGKSKPGVLVFENVKVAKVPKNILKIGERIRKRGVDYPGFEKDWATVTRWSNKVGAKPTAYPGGSPIYGGGVELEITFPPGEYIKALKKITTFRYKNTNIPVYTAEIFRPSTSLLKQINLAKLGKLTVAQVKKLERILSKKFGKKVRIETPELLSSKKYIRVTKRNALKEARRLDTTIPILRLDRMGLRVFAFLSRRAVSSKRIVRKFSTRKLRVTKRKPTKRTTIKRKSTSRTASKRKPSKRTPSKRTPGKRTPSKRTPSKRVGGGRATPTKKKPPVIIRLPNDKFKKKSLSKSQQVYYVKEKVRGKIKNLTPRPLTLREAKDFLAYRLDNRLSRTGYFEPLGKSRIVVGLPSKMKGYFGRNSRKLRPYKIKVGKKKAIRRGYIEKRKFAFDKPGEKRRVKRKVVRRKPTKKRKVSKKRK